MTSMRHEPSGTSAEEPLLLDSYLGEYDVAELYATGPVGFHSSCA